MVAERTAAQAWREAVVGPKGWKAAYAALETKRLAERDAAAQALELATSARSAAAPAGDARRRAGR